MYAVYFRFSCRQMDIEPIKHPVFSKQKATAKAEHYCAYQERSQHEVRSKLYEWGLHKRDVEEIISQLIQLNFINEERFTMAYVLGKFRIKAWGKMKIKQGLRLKKVPDKMIVKALQHIDGDEYSQTLLSLLEKKSATIAEKNPHKKHDKLMQYAMGKGYEGDLVKDILKDNTIT